jgi:hypothetical protein
MSINCSGYTGGTCYPANFGVIAKPAWAALQAASVTATDTASPSSGFTLANVSYPSWVTLTQTATSFTFSGTRPDSSQFNISFMIVSCGVITSYSWDYAGSVTPCVNCAFTLQGS